MVPCAIYTPPREGGCAWLLPAPGPGGEARAVLCATYTPAREEEVCVVLYVTYTPAPRGRRVCKTECRLHSGPEREACVWYGAGVLSPDRTTGAAARHEWTAGRGWTRQRPAGRRLNLPGEKRV